MMLLPLPYLPSMRSVWQEQCAESRGGWGARWSCGQSLGVKGALAYHWSIAQFNACLYEGVSN